MSKASSSTGCNETEGDGLLGEEVLLCFGGSGETAGDGPLDADLRVIRGETAGDGPLDADLDGCFRREGDGTVASSPLLEPGLSRFLRFEAEDTDCFKSGASQHQAQCKGSSRQLSQSDESIINRPMYYSRKATTTESAKEVIFLCFTA